MSVMEAKMDLAGPALVDRRIEDEAEPHTPERINVRLSRDVRQAIDRIAASRNISAVEAIRRAIGTEQFFLNLSNQKAKIFVQLPGEKHLKEVMFMTP